MCRWTLGTIEHRCGVTVFSETVPRKFFLVPESGNRNILLLFFSCTNKCTCGDMQDRQTSDVCVHVYVIRQLLRLPRSCMRVAKGTELRWHEPFVPQLFYIRFFARRNIVRRAGFRRDRRRANLQRRLLGSAAIVGMFETSTYHLFSTHVYPSTTSVHW